MVPRSPRTIVANALAGLVALGLIAGAPAPAIASEPSLIAFVDAGGIWTVREGSTASAKPFYVPGGATYPSGPAWSPNGEELAFVVSNSDGAKIVVANRSGNVTDTPLSSSRADRTSGSLAWAPDGRRIAYLCAVGPTVMFPDPNGFDSPEQELNTCVLDVTTGKHELLAASRSDLFVQGATGCFCRLSWSPDGKFIALDMERSKPCTGVNKPPCYQDTIGIIDVATGGITALTDFAASNPAFSPDGREIAFVHNLTEPGAPPGLDIMPASGGGARQVVALPANGSHLFAPTWAPDGKDLAYVSSAAPAKNGNRDLFSVSVKGGPSTQLTSTSGDSDDPTWAQPVSTCSVPKLKGKTLSAAKTLIKRAGCVLGKVRGPKSHRSRRHIVKQDPAAHRDVPSGTKVNVRLG